MADYVKEDKAIFLDCDLLVTGKIDHLLEYDLEDYYVAAVNDSDLDPTKHPNVKKELNSGVLVVNLKRCREENVREKLIELTREHYMHVPNGDQSIMILAFGEEWLPLKDTYNFLVGYDAYEISEFKKERTTIKENRMPRIDIINLGMKKIFQPDLKSYGGFTMDWIGVHSIINANFN